MEMIDFKAFEMNRDGSLSEASYRYEGDESTGWRILRDGDPHLELPPGYRLLRSLQCGICSTDLARHHYSYPLPQIIGHEVVAEDGEGSVVATEINASHLATGSPLAEKCPFCSRGLPTHCPDRLTLGIDRLPGGFSPWILVPTRNVAVIPDGLNMKASILIEPFAAAIHAARRLDLRGASRVGVLGVGRLGLLIIAALNVTRDASAGEFTIEAIDKNQDRLKRAAALGADETWDDASAIAAESGQSAPFDVVVEATGSVGGFQIALSLSSREVHIKSTTGLETLGFRHLTALVVDEISFGCLESVLDDGASGIADFGEQAVILGAAVSSEALERHGMQVTTVEDVGSLLRPDDGGVQADVVVVDSIEGLDLAVRPWPDIERGLVKPKGRVLVADTNQAREGLLASILDRGIRLTTSRCGDFAVAIPAMLALQGKGINLGGIITDSFPVQVLPEAFERARSPESIKVTVLHER